jgi:hypothetical protein
MKTIWRVLAILSAALIVVGALIALRQTGFAATLLQGPDRTRFETGIERGRFASGDVDRDHHTEREPDARGIIEAIRHLLIIGVIVALVGGASFIARRVLERRSSPRTEAGPPV